MNKEEFNKIFGDLNFTSLLEVTKGIDNNYYAEKNQGDVGERWAVYKLPIKGSFLKVTWEIDSYGDHEKISSLKIVERHLKEVEVYE